MPPKKDKNKIVVRKVPLDYYPERYHASFPPMPILYLELLENKQKVKKDLKNKDYIPPVDRIELSNQVPTPEQAESQVDKEIDKDFELKEYEEDNTVMKKVGKKSIKILDLTDPDKEKKEEIPEDKKYEFYDNSNDQESYKEEPKREERREVNREKEKTRSREDEDIDYDKIKKRLEQRYDKIKEDYRNSRQSRDIRDDKKNNDKYESRHSRDRKNVDYYKSENTSPKREREDTYNKYEERYEDKYESREKENTSYSETQEEEKQKNKLTNEDEVQKKIMDLFTVDDKQPTKQVSFQTSYQPSQAQSSSQTQNNQPQNSAFVPPTLSQINNGIIKDNKGVRDMTRGLSKQEDEEDAERRLYLDKFAILKRKYKDFKMPEFSPYSDISIMKRTYDSAVKQLHLDSTVETYKKYLIGGFTLTQFLFSKFLKMDMSGFAEQQILSMNQYEQVLVEIGEKTYFKAPSQMAPEFKLVMLIGFNAVIFLISKMILKASGDNILSSINKVAEKKETQSAPSAPAKNHMKGPNMDDLSDLQSMISGNKSKKD